ncbi:MAG TPA: sigma-70 family RNA polymerase sigma factor [Actinomycetota bacterium]|nr:sigma-70 family RNA polymerase sigma factor [Actinomycetota bacterium]
MDGGRKYAAVDDLYREHGFAATRLAYLLTGDRARAEDLVQDAFVRVLARVRQIREPHSLRAYLNRTLVNLAKNAYRSEGRLRAFVASGRAAPPASSSLPDLEGRDELHAHLLRLPYRQRAALVLRYCEDQSEAEVAEALGTSSKAVRSLVGRGLETIRNMNGDESDE